MGKGQGRMKRKAPAVKARGKMGKGKRGGGGGDSSSVEERVPQRADAGRGDLSESQLKHLLQRRIKSEVSARNSARRRKPGAKAAPLPVHFKGEVLEPERYRRAVCICLVDPDGPHVVCVSNTPGFDVAPGKAHLCHSCTDRPGGGRGEVSRSIAIHRNEKGRISGTSDDRKVLVRALCPGEAGGTTCGRDHDSVLEAFKEEQEEDARGQYHRYKNPGARRHGRDAPSAAMPRGRALRRTRRQPSPSPAIRDTPSPPPETRRHSHPLRRLAAVFLSFLNQFE